MGKMTFTDGMTFDTDGPLRAEHRRDGWYVVGKGMLVPVRDYADAQKFIKDQEEVTKQ